MTPCYTWDEDDDTASHKTSANTLHASNGPLWKNHGKTPSNMGSGLNALLALTTCLSLAAVQFGKISPRQPLNSIFDFFFLSGRFNKMKITYGDRQQLSSQGKVHFVEKFWRKKKKKKKKLVKCQKTPPIDVAFWVFFMNSLRTRALERVLSVSTTFHVKMHCYVSVSKKFHIHMTTFWKWSLVASASKHSVKVLFLSLGIYFVFWMYEINQLLVKNYEAKSPGSIRQHLENKCSYFRTLAAHRFEINPQNGKHFHKSEILSWKRS